MWLGKPATHKTICKLIINKHKNICVGCILEWCWCSWLNLLGWLSDMECILEGETASLMINDSRGDHQLLGFLLPVLILLLMWYHDSLYLVLLFLEPICEMINFREMIFYIIHHLEAFLQSIYIQLMSLNNKIRILFYFLFHWELSSLKVVLQSTQ